MNVKLFEYRLVDIEVPLEKAIKEHLVKIYLYRVLSTKDFGYNYFPADVGDSFAVISQEYHDGGEHIVGLIGLPDDLPIESDKDPESWILANLDHFISEDALVDWL